MRKIATLAICSLVAAGALAEDVKLRYTRPSILIGKLAEAEIPKASKFVGDLSQLSWKREAVLGRMVASGEGIVPKGVVLVAHDSSGILVIEGSDADVAKVKQLISLIDIEPRKIDLQLTVVCPVLNTETSSSTVLFNNKRWATVDDRLRLDLDLMGRINEDGTISLYLETTRADARSKMVLRVKDGETILIRLGKDSQALIGKDKHVERSVPPKGSSNIDDPDVYLELKLSLRNHAESDNVVRAHQPGL